LQKRSGGNSIVFVDMEIMKTFASRSRAVLTVGSFLLGTAPGLIAADLVLQKVPPLTVEQTPAYAANLARHHLGARVESAMNGTAAADVKTADSALLSGDPTASYSLPAGTTTLLVALPKIENLGSISFANKGAKGSVTVATSNAKLPADSPQWYNAARQELSPEGLQANVGPSEAKYVRLTFNIAEPGRIYGFGIYANPQVSDFTAPRTRTTSKDKSGSFGLVTYTDMHAKARALYVSSGSDVRQANNMIDDQTSTTYSFAAEDGTPTTVIDLGKPVTLRRLSAVYSPRAGNMEFYVMKSLPAESAPMTVTFNDAAFASMKAVGSAKDDGSQGRAAVDFPATSGRYVMVRWLPAAQQDSSFSLAEIAAFGGNKNTLLVANETSASGREVENEGKYDGKTMADGKTMGDPKDMPDEGQEQPPGEGPPPTLPDPPPFTFVPILVPTSP
jgi:hypothetical protein